LKTQRERQRSFVCKLCNKPFLGKGPHMMTHCSKGCLTKVNTAQHARYVSRNRAHIRDYARERKHRIWGESKRLIAAEAERIAASRVLPKLGFSEICHLSTLNRFFSFGLTASFKGERVLVDVTTGIAKSLRLHASMASALRLRFFILFVSLDLKFCFLTSRVESRYP
jgi:hypothetical protein